MDLREALKMYKNKVDLTRFAATLSPIDVVTAELLQYPEIKTLFTMLDPSLSVDDILKIGIVDSIPPTATLQSETDPNYYFEFKVQSPPTEVRYYPKGNQYLFVELSIDVAIIEAVL